MKDLLLPRPLLLVPRDLLSFKKGVFSLFKIKWQMWDYLPPLLLGDDDVLHPRHSEG